MCQIMSMSKMCQIASLSNGEGSFKMKECAPLHASSEAIGSYVLAPLGVPLTQGYLG